MDTLRIRQPAIESTRMKWAWGFGIAGFVLTLTIFGVILAAPLFVIAGILGMQERLSNRRRQTLAAQQSESLRSQQQLSSVRASVQGAKQAPQVTNKTTSEATESDVIEAEWTVSQETPVS